MPDTHKLERQLADTRRAWLAARQVATQRPTEAATELFGPDHPIVAAVRCDHPAEYELPDDGDLPACAGHHQAVELAREQMRQCERVAGRLRARLVAGGSRLPQPAAGHGWWLIANRPAHPDCSSCRQAPGGPDHERTNDG